MSRWSTAGPTSSRREVIWLMHLVVGRNGFQPIMFEEVGCAFTMPWLAVLMGNHGAV